MGSSRSLVRARATADEQEWVDAELSIARSWVKELALWLGEAQMRTGGKALPAVTAEDILSPRTVRLLQEEEAAPFAWGRLALLTGFVLAPWAVLGSFVYVAWPLAS